MHGATVEITVSFVASEDSGCRVSCFFHSVGQTTQN